MPPVPLQACGRGARSLSPRSPSPIGVTPPFIGHRATDAPHSIRDRTVQSLTCHPLDNGRERWYLGSSTMPDQSRSSRHAAQPTRGKSVGPFCVPAATTRENIIAASFFHTFFRSPFGYRSPSSWTTTPRPLPARRGPRLISGSAQPGSRYTGTSVAPFHMTRMEWSSVPSA
jgi:hypothetical protein